MASKHLRADELPKLSNGRLLLAFTGWMDGGDVSTGTVRWLVDQLGAQPVAEIDAGNFYIYNSPGSMEVAALFRPEVKIVDGIVEEIDLPENRFYGHEPSNLILFTGKEPNLAWREFADAIFELAARAGIADIYFVGSFGGGVPHTREPHLYISVSDASLKAPLQQQGVSFSSYEGPGSFATYLLSRAAGRGLRMTSLAAAIPAYIQGTNLKSIEAVVRRLTRMLGLDIGLEELRPLSDEWERRLNEAMKDEPDLLKQIRQMEEDYDKEIFNTQMGDLKQWLEQKGIQVD